MLNVERANVKSVYSGKLDRCCCGCAGKYSYASTYRDQVSKERGYEVCDDEVSDRSVSLVVNKMNKLFAAGWKPRFKDHQEEFVSVVNGNRVYTAYFKKV